MIPAQKVQNKLNALWTVLRNDGGAALGRTIATRVTERARSERLAREVRHLFGPVQPPGGPGDVLVLCSVRDGAFFLPTFLRHHRELGACHFVFLDNASKDGTVDMLRDESDVTVYQSRLPFAGYKRAFKRFLAQRHGLDRWVLVADIDECFAYPGCEGVDLRELTGYLDGHGFQAVVAHMLDLFDDQPILNPVPPAEDDLRRAYRLYDLEGLLTTDYRAFFGTSNRISNEAIACLCGGINYTVFGNETLLTKHIFFRWRPPMGLPRNWHDIRYASIADFSAVLYHFKFTSEFSDILRRALEERSYYGGSARYASIHRVLAENPQTTLRRDSTRFLTSVDELVNAGFLHTSPAYREWLAQHRPRFAVM